MRLQVGCPQLAKPGWEPVQRRYEPVNDGTPLDTDSAISAASDLCRCVHVCIRASCVTAVTSSSCKAFLTDVGFLVLNVRFVTVKRGLREFTQLDAPFSCARMVLLEKSGKCSLDQRTRIDMHIPSDATSCTVQSNGAS